MNWEKTARTREEAIQVIEQSLGVARTNWERLSTSVDLHRGCSYNVRTAEGLNFSVWDYGDEIFINSKFAPWLDFRVKVQPETEPTYRAETFWTRKTFDQLCMSKNWYDKGSLEDYAKLLDYVDKTVHPTTELIAWAAKDIYDHTEHDEFLDITYYMEEIANFATCTMFWEVKPDE